MFCRKCGNQIADNALFCNKCGEEIDRGEDFEIPEMSLADSIIFVDNLKSRYTEVEKMQKAIIDNESRLIRPLELNYRSYSFFRFFWKYLLFAFISFYLLLIIAALAAGNDTAFNIFLAIAFIAPVALLITGGVLSAKRREEENEAISMGNQRAKDSRQRLEKETAELKNTLAIKKRELYKAASVLPEDFRKSTSMSQIKRLLESGKASSIKEAILILRK